MEAEQWMMSLHHFFGKSRTPFTDGSNVAVDDQGEAVLKVVAAMLREQGVEVDLRPSSLRQLTA